MRGFIGTLAGTEFATSPLSNSRKGGLLGLAAATVALAPHTDPYLSVIVPPILHSFDDADSRVRYYACEALYNVAKLCHPAVTSHFAGVFDALCRLSADTDANVQNAAHLLDRLVKDIVTDSEDFEVDAFIPLLRERLQVANPFVRQLLVGWITVLDSAPDIDMLEFLPEFLDGLLNMLSDANREIRQQADAALSEFLAEVRTARGERPYGRMAEILVARADSPDEFTRLTVLTWMYEFVGLAREQLHPHLAPLLSQVLPALAAQEERIRNIALETNAALLELHSEGMPIREVVRSVQAQTRSPFEATKLAALEWCSSILTREREAVLAILDCDSDEVASGAAEASTATQEQRAGVRASSGTGTTETSPVSAVTSSGAMLGHSPGDDAEEGETYHRPLARDILECLHDPSEAVAVSALHLLALVADDEGHFSWLVSALLAEFHARSELLTSRGATLIRQLSAVLGAEQVFVGFSARLTQASNVGGSGAPTHRGGGSEQAQAPAAHGGESSDEAFPLSFCSVMAQALNLILLTADETRDLRSVLKSACAVDMEGSAAAGTAGANGGEGDGPGHAHGRALLAALYPSWCYSPVATVSLCLLAEAYDHAAALVGAIADAECDVETLVQMDRLVQLLESPVFAFLRMRLMEPRKHPSLLRTLYGLLCLLPQSTAFRTLSARLASVPPATFLAIDADGGDGGEVEGQGSGGGGGRAGASGLDFRAMLATFRERCAQRNTERLLHNS